MLSHLHAFIVKLVHMISQDLDDFVEAVFDELLTCQALFKSFDVFQLVSHEVVFFRWECEFLEHAFILTNLGLDQIE